MKIKNNVRIFSNWVLYIMSEDYIAHNEPICKTLLTFVLKIYYERMNNNFPSYFEAIKRV